ncbi:hypothetical protein K3G63_10960 [Hymenobacter sp. HSC-4F20]|uniref:hypothetical protein n=1 Tax=Hymenobacter sp. HSC-4F20 TaxID=2864135 RepID=UPI001C72F3D3|nr:hypothetical protein [Hymenobacter sp. HSC-4F20]MBX0290962.1 hypothetical protein [Hymenobacter sp. HSC-4F20]
MEMKRPNLSIQELYTAQQTNMVEQYVYEFIEKSGREAIDKVLLIGLEAFNPALAARGIEFCRPMLMEEQCDEDYSLVYLKHSGEAIMFIGKPKWPEGEYGSISEIKIEVEYELIKEEDRKWLNKKHTHFSSSI